MMEGKNVLDQKMILGQLQRRKPTAVLQFTLAFTPARPTRSRTFPSAATSATV